MWRQLQIEDWVKGRKASLADVKAPVEDIISQVRGHGDAALKDLTAKFDKVQLDDLRITKEQMRAAREKVSPQLIADLEKAAANVRRFHQLQRQGDVWFKEVEPGIILGVKTTPLERVGCYVPGGRASYPSTVIMCAVPAKVAGVRQVVLCTPPPVNPLTLVAMDVAGVDEAYMVGGAQAIAAMALGTETIRPVHKIVGPGNVFVTMAKMLLRDVVDIDFPAGPSEIAVIADSSADPVYIAADILAQAEHDPNSACVLISADPSLPDKVGKEIDRQLQMSNRKAILEKSLSNTGYILANDIDEAAMISDRLAPEHLSLQVSNELRALNAVHNAGSIFIGRYAAVACGDYASGTNHILPTAGFARMFSGLDVHHFCKRSSLQMIDRTGLESIGGTVSRLADAEGLEAHARSVRLRME
ncbi:MAG: bifunctional histidinal dehydrogenase/ histidinol dehydrogenase [Methanomassiliicoccales archaeon PtaU1.Bin124]|nr:MAG: bifunctional histidinal dehydrogenase/ histidinol dehydrogenase [Methanomassiliicoccales archaeon PtaU1.Bin124]